MAYAAGTPGASAARLEQGRLYGVFGNVKDATGRCFRSSLDVSENATALASMFSSRTPVAALPEKQ